MDDHCNICGGYITPEHGGLVCVCGSLSCISDHCSPAEFVNGDSIEIPYCFKCNPHSKRPALWKGYVKKAISFLRNKSNNQGVLSGMYWSLQWAEDNKMPKKFIALLNNKIEHFRKTEEIGK
jgi:hypothetical protein